MSNSTYILGRRIAILGVTGSDKSTLARQLGASLGLRMVELDAMRHGNGWDSMPFDEMREKLAAILDASIDGWVCEGNYSRIRDVTLSRADTVLWLAHQLLAAAQTDGASLPDRRNSMGHRTGILANNLLQQRIDLVVVDFASPRRGGSNKTSNRRLERRCPWSTNYARQRRQKP